MNDEPYTREKMENMSQAEIIDIPFEDYLAIGKLELLTIAHKIGIHVLSELRKSDIVKAVIGKICKLKGIEAPQHLLKKINSKRGYTKFPHYLLEALCTNKIKLREKSIILYNIRMTLGWQREFTEGLKPIDYKKATGIHLSDIKETFEKLERRNILIKNSYGQYKVNKYYSKWKLDESPDSETKKQSAKHSRDISRTLMNDKQNTYPEVSKSLTNTSSKGSSDKEILEAKEIGKKERERKKINFINAETRIIKKRKTFSTLQELIPEYSSDINEAT